MSDTAVLYEPATDTMRIELRPWPAAGPGDDLDLAGGEDVGEDLVIHYAPDGEPYAWEIEHASKHPEHIAAALEALRQAQGHKNAA
jgi:uncharacterized protein YuzE